jgi:hypothetical protein
MIRHPNSFSNIKQASCSRAGSALFSLCCPAAGELLFRQLSRPKMPSGANAFEISDIQEDETKV